MATAISSQQRPMSTAMPNSYATHQLQDSSARERSGSGSIMVGNPAAAASSAGATSQMHQLPQAQQPQASTSSSHHRLAPSPLGSSSTGHSSKQHHNSTTSDPPAASSSNNANGAPFQPITINQVLAAHGHDTQQALTGLLANFNAVLQDREADKGERSRLNTENSKLWNWSTSLKGERDANAKELRSLAARVIDLETLLTNAGIPLPSPAAASGSTSFSASQHLSPANGMAASQGTNGSASDIGHSSLATEIQRRPSPGPRSASDNMAVSSRERQSSLRSERERGMPGSFPHSTSVHSLPGSFTASEAIQQQRRLRAAGTSTPPMGSSQRSLTPQSHSSPFAGASPARHREASHPPLPPPPVTSSSASGPPLSSSASFSAGLADTGDFSSDNPSQSYGPSSRIGLATIPSTPVINGGLGQDEIFTSSPVRGQFGANRSDYSDTTSVERLRITKTSPHPSSPALSTHSASSSHPASHHSVSSQQPSPRSPRYPQGISSSSTPSTAIEGPIQGSPRHPNFHAPASTQITQSSTSHGAQPQYISQGKNIRNGLENAPVPGQRKLSRKASSLDLTSRDAKPSAVLPSRSATPPPDIGSPKLATSPTQYAFAPKTPPASYDSRGHSNTGTPSRTQHGTPMADMPAEARHWILASGGTSMPSPVTPFDASNGTEREVTTMSNKLGGLGISDAGTSVTGLQPEATGRQRKVSNLQQPGRVSPISHMQVPGSIDLSATAGILQDATYDSEYPDRAPANSTSAMKGSRPYMPDRSRSDQAAERPRAYTVGTNHSTTNVAQYATQPLSYRQGGEKAPVLPLQQPPHRENQHLQQSRDDYGTPSAGAAPSYAPGANARAHPVRCVPLVPGLLSAVVTDVVNSSIRTVDRGREVVSFHIRVAVSKQIQESDPRHAFITPNAPLVWIIEKSWNDLQNLDHTLKLKNSKSNLKKLPGLPDKNLFKDHAPSRVDQRKADLQRYLQGLCQAEGFTDRADYCNFLTNNVVSDRSAPVSNPGYKAGYLTKKGRNFGGWTTRYYVLQGRLLEYYDTPGGQHLGSIDIKDANIGRQNSKQSATGDDSIRHAFLIRSKDKTGEETDHILCAESDEERDHWVNMLVCCLTGEYVPDTIAAIPVGSSTSHTATVGNNNTATLSTSTSSTARPPTNPASHAERQRHGARKGSRDFEITRGAAQPIAQLSQDQSNAKLFGGPSYSDSTPRPVASEGPKEIKHRREMSAGQSSTASGPEDGSSSTHRGLRRHQLGSDLPNSSSMPANLDNLAASDHQTSMGQNGSTSHRFAPSAVSGNQVESSADSSNRPRSPDKRLKISGPSGGMPIGADFKRPREDRRNKTKSSFWDFAGRRAGDRRDPTAAPARPVFGVAIQEAVEVARVKDDSDLPAVVFRCVQYLSSVKAEKEEGIYRMSGSSAVIKALKDRFNAEGDVDLTAEYFDPHAIAGLLKQFFRELPVHIFTLELNPDFIRANDLEDQRAKIKEVTRLVQQLPVANYSALRFLSAHLVNIIKCEHINKMSVKNMGIVFSPTLAIPATLFSLFINEFDRIFREIDNDDTLDTEALREPHDEGGRNRQRSESGAGVRRRSRNSMMFMQSGADRLFEVTSDAEGGESDGPYKHNHHVGAAGRSKLTIDVTSESSPASLGAHSSSQKSPSINSASSPRGLYAQQPMRSPGLPSSPRHAEGYLPRRA